MDAAGQSEKMPRRRRTVNLWFLCAILAITILLIDLAIPLGVAGGVPYVTVVLLSLWSPRRRSTVITAIVGSVLTIAGLLYSPPGGELWKVLVNRALALLAIWVTAALILLWKTTQRKAEQAIGQREQALADLKILRGFLPICVSCKRIRDDEGSWNQLEAYIRDHSEADFSHGLCPECEKKLYADYI